MLLVMSAWLLFYSYLIVKEREDDDNSGRLTIWESEFEKDIKDTIKILQESK